MTQARRTTRTSRTPGPARPAHIVVVGGGCAGLAAAHRLQRTLRRPLGRGDVRITVVSPEPYMTYPPFLPEAAAGSLSPRHVVVPLRRVLARCRFLPGEVTAVDTAARTLSVRNAAGEEAGGEPLRLDYDELVLAPGSPTRPPDLPGLDRHALGLRTVREAIGLRNHVLEQLDIAASTRDSAVRDAALTFLFVGGGHAGVGALAELEDMGRFACRYYPTIRPDEQRWILVEPSDRILSEASERMSQDTLHELRGRNIDVRLRTRLESCADRTAVLSDGTRHPTRTLVWTADARPSPLLAACGLPLDETGRVRCTPALRVEDTEHVWAAGDAAAVPDLTAPDGTPCAPLAQHALRQGRRLADNLAAALRGRPPADYRHRAAGAVAALGLHQGVARLHGARLTGTPAWLAHRVHHLGRLPTANRKARLLAEWTLAGLFKREIVSLGSLEHPRAEFELAAGGGSPPETP
ncbi:FAD-dependent oxidoreductase [Streptomyces sp. DSM 44917]|uniref:FAD-dependent oxidoreductase n=1 Tax=Streptomyces boetiae TaxID=3075541 RepID=A0ABU2LHD7_9ACTN|nr:FAD-dependent oxidoreductase [Streptomyces sp. DSM 44917]MDT0310648.1 FAD-dependent oxidoreductase [Streptomyces sp. DSM 44917]